MDPENLCYRILGGLKMEINERLPYLSVRLAELFGEAALHVITNTWIIIDGCKIKLITTSLDSIPLQRPVRFVILELSIVKPDDNFEDLYRVLKHMYGD